ncbi:MAG: lipopolysaccharide transport periplasmic protein LptA [Deltaproteobacteria bacterium]|nr:lipopolysaccharide transport periplasmic protein LptA [Deltaproteobacteria bacterium]
MKFKLIVIFILLFLSVAGAENLKEKLETNKIPIHITSNKLIAYSNEGKYIFTGDVTVIRGELTINADKMDVYKSKKTEDIEKIVCTGDVVIRKPGEVAKGDTATYIDEEQKIILEGNASAKQKGPDLRELHGEKIIIFLNKDYTIVEGGKKKVRVIIYPKEEKKSD